MPNIQGNGPSSGIEIAKAYQLATPDLSFEKVTIGNPNQEIERLDRALEISKQELEKIREHTRKAIEEEHAEVFSAHLLVLGDPELINPIKDKRKSNNAMAETAMEETANLFIDMCKNMDNEYMRERAAD